MGESVVPSNLTSTDTETRVKVVWEEAFLAVLRASGIVRHACEAAGVSRTTAYDRRERHPDFAAAWDEAMEDACDLLEAEARRRALEGVEKPIFWQGEQVATVREYSDTLMTLVLKAHRPEKYRERVDSRLSGPGGGPIQVAPGWDLSKLTDDEIDQFEQLTAKLAANPRSLPEGT